MTYEKQPLNHAHLLDRKAEYSMRHEKYEEAINYHIEASQILRQLVENLKKNPTHPNVIESIKLQIKFHDKQKHLIPLKQKQRVLSKNDNFVKSSHEGFQNINTYSTTSIESYDSIDYTSHCGYVNTNNEQLAKRDEVIKKMASLIRQQQNEILALSNRLREKDNKNKQLQEKVEELQNSIASVK